MGKPSREGGIGLRPAGSAAWSAAESKDERLSQLLPGNTNSGWSPTDEADTLRDLQSRADRTLRTLGELSALGWHLATDAWVTRTWGQGGRIVLDGLAGVPHYMRDRVKIPALGLDGLVVAPFDLHERLLALVDMIRELESA